MQSDEIKRLKSELRNELQVLLPVLGLEGVLGSLTEALVASEDWKAVALTKAIKFAYVELQEP